MKTVAIKLYLLSFCSFAIGTMQGEILDPCQDADVVIENQHKLCVNNITPVSKGNVYPCACDLKGTIDIFGEVAIPKALATNTIGSVHGGATVLTSDVKVCDDLTLEKHSTFKVEGNLTVCGEA